MFIEKAIGFEDILKFFAFSPFLAKGRPGRYVHNGCRPAVSGSVNEKGRAWGSTICCYLTLRAIITNFSWIYSKPYKKNIFLTVAVKYLSIENCNSLLL